MGIPFTIEYSGSSKGAKLSGPVHQEQVRWRPYFGQTRPHGRPLSAWVSRVGSVSCKGRVAWVDKIANTSLPVHWQPG